MRESRILNLRTLAAITGLSFLALTINSACAGEPAQTNPQDTSSPETECSKRTQIQGAALLVANGNGQMSARDYHDNGNANRILRIALEPNSLNQPPSRLELSNLMFSSTIDKKDAANPIVQVQYSAATKPFSVNLANTNRAVCNVIQATINGFGSVTEVLLNGRPLPKNPN